MSTCVYFLAVLSAVMMLIDINICGHAVNTYSLSSFTMTKHVFQCKPSL